MSGLDPDLRPRKAPFIKLFDQTPPGIVCPHFYILAHSNGCPHGCHYCYLRLTLRRLDRPVVFNNLDDLCRETSEFISNLFPALLSCGSLSDGLAFDHINHLAERLIPIFARQPRHTLLFTTKSVNIENVLRLQPTDRVVFSFSVNSETVSRQFEPGAPPPTERLAAARRLKDAGWRIRVRLDPLMPLPNWQRDYATVIERINALQPEIVTLLGFFHFPGIREYVPESPHIFSLAREAGVDGRLRVAHPTRLAMYRFCLQRLHAPAIGLCKETLRMYHDLGRDPHRVSCNCGSL